MVLSSRFSSLECIKFLLPIGEDESDFFLRFKNSLGPTYESHILELSSDFVSWESDVNAELCFECVAVSDDVITRFDVNGLENGGRHVEWKSVEECGRRLKRRIEVVEEY